MTRQRCQCVGVNGDNATSVDWVHIAPTHSAILRTHAQLSFISASEYVTYEVDLM